jgi:hypothetical protein
MGCGGGVLPPWYKEGPAGNRVMTMRNTATECVKSEGAGLPALVLTYVEEVDGVGSVWTARSILTGHVACGTSEERARECLRRTLAGSIGSALRTGRTFEEWFRAQRPDDPRYVDEYFDRARASGQRLFDWPTHGLSSAVAPA